MKYYVINKGFGGISSKLENEIKRIIFNDSPISLKATRHADDEKKRYCLGEKDYKKYRDNSIGIITYPQKLYLNEISIEEIYLLESGEIFKLLIRTTYKANPKYDLVLVITTHKTTKNYSIITCYLNEFGDAHTTLKSDYLSQEKDLSHLVIKPPQRRYNTSEMIKIVAKVKPRF